MSLLKLEKIDLCMFIYFYTSVDRGLEAKFVNFLSTLYFLGFFCFRASEITVEIKAILLCPVKQLPHF